jgi:hypothetical protein
MKIKISQWVCVLVFFSHISIVASEDRCTITVELADVAKKKPVTLRVAATKKVLGKLGELSTLSDNSLTVNTGHHSHCITQCTMDTLCRLTEDAECEIPATCTKNIALIELAETLDACSTLQDTIAKIHFSDPVYDSLLDIALAKDATWFPKNDSLLGTTSARTWFVRCIGNAPDKKKTKLRKKLYPLQYSSPEFTALRNKILQLLKVKKTKDGKNNRPEFCTLEEFNQWKNSFLHQAYCAAIPSIAISCAEFQSLGGSHGRLVDLSDCYVLNNDAILNCYRRNVDGTGNIYRIMGGANHLRQIHLPLLELLIHYKEIDYGLKEPFDHFWSRINFGNNTVDLDPVDIRALSLFQPDYNYPYEEQLVCEFQVASKKAINSLKQELAYLRAPDKFYINVGAPDASNSDCRLHWIWVDHWFLKGTLAILGLYALGKLSTAWAHAEVQAAQTSYDTELNAYNVCLQECLSTIPEHVQAIAGYLVNNTGFIRLSLPSGLKMPPFIGDPSCITLPQIETAVQAANTLNQIESPWYPFFGFWSFTAVIPTCLLFGAAHLIKSIALKFFKIRLNFIAITACYVTIFKSKPETNKGESAPS